MGAFEQLYHLLYPIMVQSSYRYLGDEASCKDVVQEVFLKLWEDRASIEILGSVKAYVLTAVRNRSLNELKKKTRSWQELDQIEVGTAKTTDPGLQIEGKEISEIINHTINLMPPRCRTIYLLKREEGLTLKEIAAQLEISSKTVENQMTKALKMLAVALSPHVGIVLLAILLIGKWGLGLLNLSY